jgi:hypothetical protein
VKKESRCLAAGLVLALTAGSAYAFTVSVTRRDPAFTNPRLYRTAALLGYRLHPTAVALRDVNSDGRRDLVAAGTNVDGEVSGRSGFGPVAIGDLTGDGTQDVAVGQDTGDGDKPRRITVLVGRGDGTFTRRLDYPTGPSLQDAWAPRGIAIGHLDGDGRLDLAPAKWSGVSVLLNRTRR